MKSQRAIKEHKSIMHGLSISPTELLQRQVKCFVFIKWAHSWYRFRWGRQEGFHEKQIHKNYSWRERAYFLYFLIRELNSIAEKNQSFLFKQYPFPRGCSTGSSTSRWPIQPRTSAKQMTNFPLTDTELRVRRGRKHNAPTGSLGEMDPQSSLTSEVGQIRPAGRHYSS